MGLKVKEKQAKTKRLKKFELLFNELSDAMFLHDFEGNILKVNEFACERLGYSKEEFALMNVRDFASEDIIENWETRIAKIKKGGRLGFETTYFSKDNQQLDVEIISKIITIDSKVLVLSSGRDITKRKNYEKQLVELQKITQENEFELKTIFNKAPSTMILFDEDSKVLRINQKGLLKFGIGVNDIVNKLIGNVINCVKTKGASTICGFTDSCLNCQLAEILKNTISKGTEYNKKEITIDLIENGSVVKKTMLISTSFLKKNGKSTYLATIDDITARKKMETDLIAAKEKAEESEKLKTAFLNNISHEIRTPLNGILGFVDFFDDDNYNFTKEEKRHFVETMQKSSDRLINTVTDLVEASKLDCGILTNFEDEVELSEELQVFVKKQKIRFENPDILFDHKIDSSLKNQQIVIDKTKLFQILKNLVNNAYKFTTQGKVILTTMVNGNNLIFSVADTGVGIDPKYKDCIYEPFRQAELTKGRIHEGTGLGLTISKKLVDKLGGNIWFDSTPGEGTTFYFSVPFIPVDKEPEKSKNTRDGNSSGLNLNGKKILIAEDEITNYLFLEAVLNKEGCQLVHASNGKEALEIYSKDPTFDIIIMDLQMPVMDGFEATFKIKAIRQEIPIVAYSAYVLDDEKQKALKAGCVDFLSKPVGREQVLTVLEKHINLL
ncbi:ATP-binding protein [Draconibacterium halophilum]|uniref:histidine kinase n=1 Tax=Draconibacterium halophilum TaxID=2706887 RepID=A0A6C0RG01_9BACT|nr:ATP-binding protein [Draconibacterium halophilum]QIA09340.1 PAS domain S-box protein [Draconibacterium halophilum]